MKHVAATPTTKGPAEIFTGDVHFDVIARGEASRLRVNTVRFSPCARTAWHSHSLGQMLHVTDGICVVATRESVIIMRAGDTVHTPPGEEHWHGALPDHFMSHLAMWEDDDATWAAEGVAVQLRALSGGKPSTAQAHIYVFRHVPNGSADAFVRNSRRCKHAPVTSS